MTACAAALLSIPAAASRAAAGIDVAGRGVGGKRGGKGAAWERITD